jgi:hypothetical protein
MGSASSWKACSLSRLYRLDHRGAAIVIGSIVRQHEKLLSQLAS